MPNYWDGENGAQHGSGQWGGNNGDYAGADDGMGSCVGVLACAFGDGTEQEMGLAGDNRLPLQRGLSPPSRVMSKHLLELELPSLPLWWPRPLAVVPPPSASIGGAAGHPALPVGVGASSSTPTAARPGGSASSTELAGGAAGSPVPPEGSSSTSAAAGPGCRVSSSALAEEATRQSAPPEGVCHVSVGGGDVSGGTDRAQAAVHEKEDVVYKTGTAPIADHMPPDKLIA